MKCVNLLFIGIGSVFATATVASCKFGGEFEQTMANASTMFGDVAVDTDSLNAKILEMSNSTGIAATEFGDGLYQAMSAGIPVTEDMAGATAFLEENAKLAKAGFTDLTSAIDISTSILNAYHMEVEDTDKVHKILMQTQNKGKTTIAELSSAISNVTPTATAMGVEFEQVGASLATMTAQGVPTAQATTQLNQLFAELGKEGTKANTALLEATEGTQHAGKSFQQLMDEGVPLSEVLDLIDKNAQKNGKSMIDMFSSIDAGKAALSMSGQNAKAFSKNLEAMSTEADVVGEAFDNVTGTSGEQMKQILNELKNMLIELFEQLQPAIEKILPKLAEVIEMLLPPIMEMVDKLLPPLMSLIDTLLPPLTELLSSILPPLTETITKIITAITPIIEKIMPVLIQLLETLLPPILNLIEAVLPPLIVVIEALLPPIISLIEQLLPPLCELIEALAPLFDALTPIIELLANIISGVLGEAIENIMPIIEGVMTVLGGLIDFITGVFSGDWEKAWEGITGVFSGIWETMKAIFKAPINWIIDGLNAFIREVNKVKIPDWVPGVGGKGINISEIPRLKVGMDYVPSDYFPAYLDAGEAVLTADEAQIYRGLGGKGSLQEIANGNINSGSNEQSGDNFTQIINAPKSPGPREVAKYTRQLFELHNTRG